MSYVPVTTFRFEPNESNGSLSDNITFVNVPVLVRVISIHYYIQKLLFSFVILKGLSDKISPLIFNVILSINKAKLFTTRTIDEIISGYKDPILVTIKNRFPDIIKDDIFGLLRAVNISLKES